MAKQYCSISLRVHTCVLFLVLNVHSHLTQCLNAVQINWSFVKLSVSKGVFFSVSKGVLSKFSVDQCWDWRQTTLEVQNASNL